MSPLATTTSEGPAKATAEGASIPGTARGRPKVRALLREMTVKFPDSLDPRWVHSAPTTPPGAAAMAMASLAVLPLKPHGSERRAPGPPLLRGGRRGPPRVA